jgi:coenzyme F420-reducing hydrogenase alpha subunit
LVETVHCFEESRSLIDDLLKEKIDPAAEMAEYEPRAGRGVGVVEAPRGLLIHDYRYDEEGKCEWANMIIPTAQNLANLESDLKAHAETITDQEEGDVRRRLEMLVRAYDPCISCSTH